MPLDDHGVATARNPISSPMAKEFRAMSSALPVRPTSRRRLRSLLHRSRCAARGSDHADDRSVSSGIAPVTPHGSVPGCVAMESFPSSRNGSALDHAAQDDHGRSMSISTVAATSSNDASAGARSPAPLSPATSSWWSTICTSSRLPSSSAICVC